MNRIKNTDLKIYIMHCSNSMHAGELDCYVLGGKEDEFKIMSLPCAGKVDILYLIKAFETGADGIVLVTCGKSKCRNIEGNLRAPKRAEKVNSLINEIGMGHDRVVIIQRDDDNMENIVSGIRQFCTRLRKINSLSAVKVS